MTPIRQNRMSEFERISLKAGGHATARDGYCAMELAAYLAGETWTDRPQCVCPVIGTFMRAWNDALPSDADRNRLLKPLVPLVLDTRASEAAQRQRSYLALDWLMRTYIPAACALTDDLVTHATALRRLTPIIDADSFRAAIPVIEAAGDAAWAAAWDTVRAATWDAAWDAAWDTVRDAAWAATWDAVRDAAKTTANAVVWDVDGAALAHTVAILQASAVDLVRAMVAVIA